MDRNEINTMKSTTTTLIVDINDRKVRKPMTTSTTMISTGKDDKTLAIRQHMV